MSELIKKAQGLAKTQKTPFLLVDLKSLREKYRKLKKVFSDIEIYYAMKANDHSKILEVLAKENAGFEVTSQKELEELLLIKVPARKIVSFNPIKKPEFIEFAHQKGVELFAFDSFEEAQKLAKYAPKSKVVLRISVDNTGSDWPLTRKFGIPASSAMKYLRFAKKLGLIPYGLTIHPGSQCLNIANWANGLYTCERIWHQAEKKGMILEMLSLGGGIPIQHTKKIPYLEEIYKVIKDTVDNNFSGRKLRISIEPGRAMVGDSAILASSVIGKANRAGGEKWFYLDVGVFNGLMETVEKFRYTVETEKGEKNQKSFTLAGPSCDSVDIVMENVMLPDLKIGDRVYFINAGAYTTVYASHFNGFAPPKVCFIN